MRVLTAEVTARVDRAAVEELGLPGAVLMENAALGLAEAVGRSFPEAGSVAVFCGPGNNGGDGLALARHLAVRGYRVTCFLVFLGKEARGDAATQLAVCRNLGRDAVELVDVGPGDGLDGVLRAARDADLVVDALFGTGLGRPLEGQPAELVAALDALPVPKLAVDLPSGLNGSRQEVFGPHLRADVTVTFGTPKPAQVFPPAADAVGELVVADLGIPESFLDRDWGEEDGPLHLLLAEEAAGLLLPRRPDTHKGHYGHLLVVAGATGKAGAAILTARAAMRAGAGLVTAAVPEPIVQTVDGGSVESMSLALPASAEGTLAAGGGEAILEAAADKDALALGPGLGPSRSGAVAAEVRRAVLECPLPAILDADGVNAFAGRDAELARRRAPTVLTPHPGELGRLLGVGSGEVVGDRLGWARRGARETGAVVVLKGHLSLIAEPQGAVWVNPTGNPGMASGGTGDVLTGVVGSLLAQGHEPLAAALLAVYLHGLAGDRAAEERGETALCAGDLVDALGRAFVELAGS